MVAFKSEPTVMAAKCGILVRDDSWMIEDWYFNNTEIVLESP